MKAVLNNHDYSRQEDITIEDLKDVTCFKGLGDDELREAVEVIKKFTQIVYEIFAATSRDIPVIEMNNNKIKAA